jgi:hypothetical protein
MGSSHDGLVCGAVVGGAFNRKCHDSGKRYAKDEIMSIRRRGDFGDATGHRPNRY